MPGEGKRVRRAASARPRCGACGKSVAGTHRFCPHCGAPIAGPVPRATAPATRVSAGPSLQVKSERADALEEQRKVVTVLFVDLAGSTPLAERLDPEEWRGMLGRYFAVLSRNIERFGGTIDKYIGDAVMAVFGAPIAREDDPHRAINAALAVRAEMAKVNDDLEGRYGARLNLRLGINSGEVVAGLLAGGVEGAYTVTGDTVNTAQRLESAAPPNEILVGEVTHHLTRRAFVFEQLPALTLKGKREPVAAYRVVMRERRAVPREERTPFVGRDAELSRLRGLFAEAASGQGRIVHIHGEAGVGKSRLLLEFFSSLPRDAARLRARCTSFEGSTPYALVADVFRRAFGIQPMDEEAAARSALVTGLASLSMTAEESTVNLILEVLGYEQRSVLDPETKRRILVSLVRRFIARRSALAPLVVVAEDMHWVDSASALLFAEVLKDFDSLACLFVTTSREESVPWPAERVTLEPLDEDAAGALIDRVAAAPLAPELRATLLERTAGNPFFLEEVLRSLDGRVRPAVPATVQELLQARLDDLNPGAKRVAQRAAVIGRFFSTRVLAELTPEEPLEAALAELEREGFISPRAAAPELVYGFRHALMQETAYQVQLMAQRRVVHGKVGEAIEALYAGRLDEFVDILALHYDRSDNDSKALQWLVRAGDRAKSLFANDEAVSLYHSALRRAADGEGPLDASTILEHTGDVQRLAARLDDASGSYQKAQESISAPTPATVARLRRKIGYVLRTKGLFPEAFAAFNEGLAALGSDGGIEAAWLHFAIGDCHWRRGEYDAAEHALGTAIEIGERLGDDDLLAEALNGMGNVLNLAGDAQKAARFYQRSREIYERREDLRGISNVRSNLGVLYQRMGRFDEALVELLASLALRERMGNPWGIGTCHNNMGDVYRVRGQFSEAIAAYRRAIEIWQTVGYAAGVAIALVGLGAALTDAGDIEDGRAKLLDAEGRFAAVGSTAYLPDLYRFLASTELKAGDLGAAARAAQRSLEFAHVAKARHQEAMTRRVLGQIALARGDVDAARTLLEESRRTLEEMQELAELRLTEEALRATSA